MFRGSNKPTRRQLFGPSASGGAWADRRQDSLYMRGEGLGSLPWADVRSDPLYMRGEGFGKIFSSLFRKIIPAASKTVKKIANSSIVQAAGKQAIDSGINALVNVTADTLSGDKSAGQAASDEIQNARTEIASAIRTANSKRKQAQETPVKKKKRKKIAVKAQKKKRKRTAFDDDDDY